MQKGSTTQDVCKVKSELKPDYFQKTRSNLSLLDKGLCKKPSDTKPKSGGSHNNSKAFLEPPE